VKIAKMITGELSGFTELTLFTTFAFVLKKSYIG